MSDTDSNLMGLRGFDLASESDYPILFIVEIDEYGNRILLTPKEHAIIEIKDQPFY